MVHALSVRLNRTAQHAIIYGCLPHRQYLKDNKVESGHKGKGKANRDSKSKAARNARTKTDKKAPKRAKKKSSAEPGKTRKAKDKTDPASTNETPAEAASKGRKKRVKKA